MSPTRTCRLPCHQYFTAAKGRQQQVRQAKAGSRGRAQRQRAVVAAREKGSATARWQNWRRLLSTRGVYREAAEGRHIGGDMSASEAIQRHAQPPCLSRAAHATPRQRVYARPQTGGSIKRQPLREIRPTRLHRRLSPARRAWYVSRGTQARVCFPRSSARHRLPAVTQLFCQDGTDDAQ